MKLKVTGFVLAIVTILVATFIVVPNESEANLDVSTSVLVDVNKEIGATGYQKKEELLNQDTTSAATKKAKDELDPFIQEQQAELERLLQEYYDAKLNNLLSDEDLALLKQQIIGIREDIYNRYKTEIDTLFQ